MLDIEKGPMEISLMMFECWNVRIMNTNSLSVYPAMAAVK